MPTYGVTGLTSGANLTSVQALWEFYAGANAPCLVHEFGASQVGSQQCLIGLCRPSVVGVPSSTLTPVAESHSDAPTPYATAAVAWTTAPVFPNNMFRRSNTSTTGHTIIMAWPRGLQVPAGASIAMVSIGTSTSWHAWTAFDE